MMKILTIDFDIIMAPSIQSYNGLVNDIEWDRFEELNPAANLAFYERLTNWLLDNMTLENTKFINSHEEILGFIPEGEEVEIYNIDHHHDCGYHGSADEPLNCGNWVAKIPNLKKYTWINDANSDINTTTKLINGYIDFEYYDLKYLPKPDLIVICYSKEWIPPRYRRLFKIWQKIGEKLYGENWL